MIFCDTHTHVYQPDFDADRNESIEKAIAAGVKFHILPNIDKESVDRMLALTQHFPGNCFPMMGLHPSSVKASFEEEMWVVESLLQKRKWCAIGECGIDLYWDTQFFAQQETVFRVHIEWALQYDLPLVIHSRNSLNEIFRILDDYRGSGLRGVFHCYPGSVEQAQVVIQQGFLLGIGVL
jgi:TatD DNase family protein